MSVVGYTVFGRPVQHEYVSNGLFNELDLNNESYLSDRIELKGGQHLAIMKRYTDNNGVEVIVVLVNSFAVSYNDRAGGFVGAGIAFIGKPKPKLIYHRLKQLHQKSLSLIHRDNYKFKTPKIDSNQVRLPDLNEEGLFMNRNPKKCNAKNINIGVVTEGNFYESLMSAIQGFAFNDSYYGVKTAYASNHVELLKRLVPEKYIYQVYNLVDYSHTLNKFKDYLAKEREKLEHDQEESKKQIKENEENSEDEINKRKQELDEFEKKLNNREEHIKGLESNKHNLENEKKQLENNEIDLNGKIKRLKSELTSKKVEKEQLEKKIKVIKNDKFKELINRKEFKEQKEKYDNELVENSKREQEKNAKTDWFKVVLAFTTLLFLILSMVFSILFYKKTNELNKTINDLKETNESYLKSIISGIPKEMTVNEFRKIGEDNKEKHKTTITEAVKYFKINKTTNLPEELSKRKWNFREILNENEPNKIEEGWETLDLLKNHLNINNKYFNKPYFLIKDIKKDDVNANEIDYYEGINEKNLLPKYLKFKNNIYDEKNIKYTIPQNDKTFQESDPVFLMHFRWMIYKFNNDKDIKDFKSGQAIKVPVIK